MLLGQGEASANGDITDRIAGLNRNISATPDGPGVAALFLSRAELHRLNRDWQRSLSDLEAASRLSPNLTGLELQRGMTLLGVGRSHEAVLALKDHLSSHPDDGFAWIQLGRALAHLELYPDAPHAFARAIELSRNPGPGLFLEQADAIQAQGPTHFADALRVVESGIVTIGPAISLELRALSLERELRRFDHALNRVSSLADGAQSKAPWLLRKGEILLLADRPEEARHTLEEAKRLAATAPLARRHTPSNTNLVRSIEDLLVAAQE
jgi:tetratricopeptide (TPR) repeat protein